MERIGDRFSRIEALYESLKDKLLPLVDRLLDEDEDTELLKAQAKVLRHLAPPEARGAVDEMVRSMEEGRTLAAVLAYGLGHELATREALEVPYPVTQLVEPPEGLDGDWYSDALSELGVNGHERDWLDGCIAQRWRAAEQAMSRAYRLCPNEWGKRMEDEYLDPFSRQEIRLIGAMYHLGKEAARKEQGR